MEVEACGFQETILEVVEVKEYALLVKLRLRIAHREIQSTRTTYLYVRQLAYCSFQQFTLLHRISAACITSSLYGVKERAVTKVILQITHLVIADSEHTRHRQFSLHTMLGKTHESMVFLTRCALAPYNGMTILTRHTIILTITAGTWQTFCLHRFLAAPFLI